MREWTNSSRMLRLIPAQCNSQFSQQWLKFIRLCQHYYTLLRQEKIQKGHVFPVNSNSCMKNKKTFLIRFDKSYVDTCYPYYPKFLVSGAFQNYLRDPKCWHKSYFNPNLDRGGHIVPLPSILCSGALNIDLRGLRFWYNSYFIFTSKVCKVGSRPRYG